MQKIIIVLGMQRSGTSCLAGILEEAGVDFGNISKFNRCNKKGNRENIQIMRLHDDLLRHNNGSWDNPPLDVKWPDHLKRQQACIIREYDHFPVWGFKDPRTLLTIDGWLDVLPNVSLVGTFRHPVTVAGSLLRRDNSSFEKSFKLWKIYNEKLLFYYTKYRFPIISFDLPEKKYKKKIIKLLKFLHLDFENNADEFYSNELRHETITIMKIPEDIMTIFQKLNQVSI